MDTRLLGIRHNGSCYRGPLTGLVGELDTSDTGFRIRIRFHSMGCFRVAVPEEWIEKF